MLEKKKNDLIDVKSQLFRDLKSNTDYIAHITITSNNSEFFGRYTHFKTFKYGNLHSAIIFPAFFYAQIYLVTAADN